MITLSGSGASFTGHHQPEANTASQSVLTIEQVAVILQCHVKTVRLMAVAGKIPAFRVGRLWRFSASRIHAWIENAQQAA